MPSVQPEFWRGAPNCKTEVRCNNMQCKQWFDLVGYKISDTGNVTPETVHCPHCKWWQGTLRLVGWPPMIDLQ